MNNDSVIEVSSVSKKFSRNLKSLMKYGLYDCTRNILGANVDSSKLRKDEFWAVDNVSFDLKKGEVLGLIGRNGSGKSTILKMLNGIYMPDKGIIKIHGRVGALIEVGAGFHPLLTGNENIYINGAILGMNKKEIDAKYNDIVNFADIGDFINSPIKTYSSGMHVRLGFAIAVHSEPDILLVDEVLAVGDVGFTAKCQNKIGEIRKKGTSIILVTHNMHTLAGFADKAILLNYGKIDYYGDVSKAIEKYMDFFIKESPDDSKIEKVVSSTDEIKFHDIEFLPSRDLNPGDNLVLKLNYETKVDLYNVEIDILIREERTADKIYFQGTNKSFNKKINLLKEKNVLLITIQDIPINNSNAYIYLTIWKDKHEKVLFWWRNIKVRFKQMGSFSGESYLKVDYENC